MRLETRFSHSNFGNSGEFEAIYSGQGRPSVSASAMALRQA